MIIEVHLIFLREFRWVRMYGLIENNLSETWLQSKSSNTLHTKKKWNVG